MLRQMALECASVPPRRLASSSGGAGVIDATPQKRATAMYTAES